MDENYEKQLTEDFILHLFKNKLWSSWEAGVCKELEFKDHDQFKEVMHRVIDLLDDLESSSKIHKYERSIVQKGIRTFDASSVVLTTPIDIPEPSHDHPQEEE